MTLTVTEAAEALGISRASAYEAARTGALPVLRFGRRLLVPRAAFDRLLETGQLARPNEAAGPRKRAKGG
jgi:excisionase family DNA binding protein